MVTLSPEPPVLQRHRQDLDRRQRPAPGTKLKVEGTGTVTVTEVKNREGTQEMRDLTVATVHTYHVMAGKAAVLAHNCDDHVVLGINPHSDDLAESLRAGGDRLTHTFNNRDFGSPGISGRPRWMEGVEEAIGNTKTKISVALDEIPGGSANERFGAAYKRGVPIQGDWQAAALTGNGTAWELAKLGNAVRLGRR